MLTKKSTHVRLFAVVAAGILISAYAMARSDVIFNAGAHAQESETKSDKTPELASAQSNSAGLDEELPEEVDEDDAVGLDLPIGVENDDDAGENQIEDIPGSMNFDENGTLVRSEPRANHNSSMTSEDEVSGAE